VSAPLLTVLNFSGGHQSSWLLWEIILELVPRPPNFVVMRADPGMEDRRTYEYCNMMEVKCLIAGIEIHQAPGPNLYQDLVALPTTRPSRFDNPPYWTKDRKTGKRGMLKQKCTQIYKIAAMDRLIRRLLNEKHGISLVTRRPGNRIVEKWIGFTADEADRVEKCVSKQKYVYFDFPLHRRGLAKADTAELYRKHDVPEPPRSVCNACFANGVQTFKEMHDERPEDWAQAVAVDNAVRDLTFMGVNDEVFVSSTLLPLEELARRGFVIDDDGDEDGSCDSGHCFI
jgi:hypothetical protein